MDLRELDRANGPVVKHRKPLMRACDRCGKQRVVRYDRRNFCEECRSYGLRPIPNWMEYGACRNPAHNPDWWWPDNSDPETDTTRLALNICGHCPVRDLCLDFAIHNTERAGIWGGLLPDGRHAIANLRRRKAN